MRKKWKRSFVTALSVALAVGNCVPAMAASTGWKQTAAGWQYVNSNGSVQKGWFQDTDGKWYFLDYNTGVMKNGWIKPKDGKWYFMDYHTGAMKTGWIKPKDGKWYYLGASGDMKTGWLQTADGKYYYLDAASGAMQTGTITVNNQVWTLDANGVWDGKAASSVTYVSSGRPSSGGGSSSSAKDEWSKGGITVKKVSGGYDVTVTGENVTVNEKTINAAKSGAAANIQDLIISKDVKDGDVKLDEIVVKGETIIEGGGSNTITFNNCQLKGKLKMQKKSASASKALHVKFTGEKTKIEKDVEVDSTFGVMLDLGEGIEILGNVLVNSALQLKGGKVANITVAAKQIVVLVNVTVNNVTIESGAELKADKDSSVTGTIKDNGGSITGEAKVDGYYEVTLIVNKEEGYWLVDNPTAANPEDENSKIKEDKKVVKVKDKQPASSVKIEEPTSAVESKMFAGWKDKDGNLVKLTDVTSETTLTATWSDKEVAAPVVETVSATVSGTSVAVKVENEAATIVVPNTTTGSAITVSNIKATAKVGGKNETVNATTTPSEVKIGDTVDFKFKFGTQEVIIKVTFTTN